MNYPLKQKPIKQNFIKKNEINYTNRGMDLEYDLNLSNQYYLKHNIAVIYKKPTPIKVVNITFQNKKAIINEAYFKEPSTTDYNGLYQGKYIDFEAKEVSNHRFALSNIHPHQVDHLRKVIEHGGVAFIIVRFIKQQKTYLLMASHLIHFIEHRTEKSIPLSFFEEEGIKIKESFMPRLDYLQALEKCIWGGKKYEKENNEDR